MTVSHGLKLRNLPHERFIYCSSRSKRFDKRLDFPRSVANPNTIYLVKTHPRDAEYNQNMSGWDIWICEYVFVYCRYLDYTGGVVSEGCINIWILSSAVKRALESNETDDAELHPARGSKFYTVLKAQIIGVISNPNRWPQFQLMYPELACPPPLPPCTVCISLFQCSPLVSPLAVGLCCPVIIQSVGGELTH